jgi:DNA-binding beta-propeller fold protein YncE
VLALAACTASASQVAPPVNDFYFPTGLAITPDERFLFVVNANSDFRYSAGSIQVVDLDAVDAVANGWRDGASAPAGCSPIAARPTILSCPSAGLVVQNAGVQIGNFGVSAAVMPLEQDGAPSSSVRVFVTVRGDPSITWADFDSNHPALTCASGGPFARCDQPHRLVRYRDDADLPSLPPEPFDVALDPLSERGYVTHLTTGQVTLITAPNTVGSTPRLETVVGHLWNLSNVDGTLGATGVAPRLPGDPRGLVYVTSRSEARVSLLHAVTGPLGSDGKPTTDLAETSSFLYDGLTAPGDSGDARNLAFSADGNHGYFISRTPPALRLFDTSLDEKGAPRDRELGIVEVCRQPANLALADFGEGVRAAVPCFADGQLWVVDPEGLRLIAVEDAGRGPSGVAVSARRKKIYVGNYAEDTLSIIDATPGSPWQHRSVLRIGTPRGTNP